MNYGCPDGRNVLKYFDCAERARALFSQTKCFHERYIKAFGEDERESGLVHEILECAKSLKDEEYHIRDDDSRYFETVFDICGRYLYSVYTS